VKVKIGGWQEPRDDQQFWTVELARERARAVLGQLAGGTVTVSETRINWLNYGRMAGFFVGLVLIWWVIPFRRTGAARNDPRSSIA